MADEKLIFGAVLKIVGRCDNTGRLGEDLIAEMSFGYSVFQKWMKTKSLLRRVKTMTVREMVGLRTKGNCPWMPTVSPQDIAYTTELNLLNEGRQKVIDFLYFPGQQKPRTSRQKACKDYLHVAQNRNPSRKKVRKAIGKQLNNSGT